MAEIATQIAPGAHAALLVGPAGWLGPPDRSAQHHAHPIAGKMPGAESQENVLAVHARQLALEQIFKSFDDIVDHCCDAWNKLIDQPWRIISIGLREWEMLL